MDKKRERKERQGIRAKEKDIEVQNVKPPTLTWAIDAIIGEEEHQKTEKKKETRRKEQELEKSEEKRYRGIESGTSN